MFREINSCKESGGSVGKDCFVEGFVDASLAVCIERDTKGLYRKDLKGELKYFTGVDSPYEVPSNPQVTFHSAIQAPE